MDLSEAYNKRLKELSGIIQEDRKRVDYLKGKFTLKYPPQQRKEAEKVFRQIVASDPSKNKQYSQWLLNLFTFGSLKLEDLYKATEYLHFFDELKRKNIIPLDRRDIGQFKSLQELHELISELGGTGEIKEDEKYLLEDKFFINNGQAEVIFENNHWLVVTPKTYDASKFYGCSSQWCTNFPDKFESYSKDGPLLVIIDKTKLNQNGNDRRYQFHFPSDQFMDFADSPINLNDFLHQHSDLTIGLSKFIGEAIDSGYNVLNAEDIAGLSTAPQRNPVAYFEFEMLPVEIQKVVLKRIVDKGLIVNTSWIVKMDKSTIPAYIDNRLRKNGVNGFENIWDFADNTQKVYYFKKASSQDRRIPDSILKKADGKLVRFYLDKISQSGKIIPDSLYDMFYDAERKNYLNGLSKISILDLNQVTRKQASDLGDDRSKKLIIKVVNRPTKFPFLLTNEFFNGLSDNVKNFYIGQVYQLYRGNEESVSEALTKHQLAWGRQYGFLS